MPTYRMFRQFVEEHVLAVRDQRVQMYEKTCNGLRNEWQTATPERRMQIRDEYARALDALRDWTTISPERLAGFANLFEHGLQLDPLVMFE